MPDSPPERPDREAIIPLVRAAIADRGFATLSELTAATNGFPVDVLGAMREMERTGTVEHVAGWRGKGGRG